MKKIVPILTIILSFISCSKDKDLTIQYGNVDLNLSKSNNVFVNTKAENIDDYTVVITKSGASEPTLSDTYSNIKDGASLEAGSYSIYAQNISSANAHSLNNNRGAQHFYGSTQFDITPGNVTSVSFTCQMINSKVSVEYDQTFKDVFKMENTVTSTYESSLPSRVLEFSNQATLDSEEVYFNLDASNNGTLNYTISTKRNDGVDKSYTGTLTLSPKSWHKLTIKATSTNGQAGFVIDVDETIAVLNDDIMVDPY